MKKSKVKTIQDEFSTFMSDYLPDDNGSFEIDYEKCPSFDGIPEMFLGLPHPLLEGDGRF